MAEEEQAVVEILLLEDDSLDAELITNRLQRTNLSVHITRVGARAEFEEAIHARRYDLLLADFALPDFDGMSALALAREVQPWVPFIFISGRVGEEVAIDTLQRGATDYVLKHRIERLVPAVVRALRESREHSTRVEAEAAFRQSELRFQNVINAVPQMIWVSKPDGHLLYSNRAWLDYVGEETANCCTPAFFHGDDYPAFFSAWSGAQSRLQVCSAEVRLRRFSDSAYRWHLMRIAPMSPEPDTPVEQATAWLGTATDLQDQKLNEEALRTAEKLAVTGRMAAAIAHEINNPLESITNLLFLVRTESEHNQRAIAFLDMAENELTRISTITKQTLQFYRDPSVPVEIDARELLGEVLGLFATRLAGKSVHAKLHIVPGIVFEGIKGEIRQVLINLLNNAIDAVSTGGKIDIEGSLREFKGTPAVEIRVCDNGSGFTPEQGERLFQPFFSTKGAHGTGLGLWVSRGILEKHGGTLHLHTDAAGGPKRTSAVMVLPVQASAHLRENDSH